MTGLIGMEGGATISFAPELPSPPQPPRVRTIDSTSMPLHPFTSVDAAIAAVEALDGGLEKFELAVADSLQDYLGVQMAQITDSALARGWEPVSFLQKEGFRLYRYEAMRSYTRRGKRR
ncbi:hypothetical protein A3K87_27905 [Variovorax paradoxus]|uniref:Uncharacterized protein n=1 Tax=Variovorax paradoxus TaxID=34073 RepID=A0AA91I8Q6_VARPD|nr:hypothetical protein [Variovorax paradoxus]OAK58862.1 hypothetical protein A3K87_27905 [Variovorax paradoxus]